MFSKKKDNKNSELRMMILAVVYQVLFLFEFYCSKKYFIKTKRSEKKARNSSGLDYQSDDSTQCMPGYPCRNTPCMPGYPCNNTPCMPGYPCPEDDKSTKQVTVTSTKSSGGSGGWINPCRFHGSGRGMTFSFSN